MNKQLNWTGKAQNQQQLPPLHCAPPYSNRKVRHYVLLQANHGATVGYTRPPLRQRLSRTTESFTEDDDDDDDDDETIDSPQLFVSSGTVHPLYDFVGTKNI
jgi:hypothetical protein